jgi:hypothetical protein
MKLVLLLKTSGNISGLSLGSFEDKVGWWQGVGISDLAMLVSDAVGNVRVAASDGLG